MFNRIFYCKGEKHMTSKERFTRMYQHKEADRIPIVDLPWAGTFRRWHREGMPENIEWTEYFDIDKTAGIGCDITPRYEHRIIEETDDYVIYTTAWGATQKSFKKEDSSPEFIDFKVNTSEAWLDAKRRMTVDDNRINWEYLKKHYPRWIADGRWISAEFWFGFDVAHSWMVGTETLLVAMYEEPEWVRDIFETYLDMCIAHFDRIWDAGYRFDCISWPDDMGYKNTTFFSNEMYRELLKPVHKRAVDWAHNKGIYAHLHSCGNIMSRIPDLVDIGIDALNPLEVKAGMDPVALKKQYGNILTLHGGINAVLWDDKEAILSEIDRIVPVLKENGGYIFSSDHSIPNTVSLDNFKAIINEVKKIGSY
jgi:uroporphyrinogen decarboxylase